RRAPYGPVVREARRTCGDLAVCLPGGFASGVLREIRAPVEGRADLTDFVIAGRRGGGGSFGERCVTRAAPDVSACFRCRSVRWLCAGLPCSAGPRAWSKATGAGWAARRLVAPAACGPPPRPSAAAAGARW